MLPYFDAHCDTVAAIAHRGGSLLQNEYHIDLARLAAYAPRAQVFALFGNIGRDAMRGVASHEEFIDRIRSGVVKAGPESVALYRALRAAFDREMAANTDHVLHCLNSADLDRAACEGKTAAILAVEGAETLFGMTADDVYAEGIRLVTLTWNYRNQMGGTNMTGGGITDEGRAFVRRANELGIVIDLSHGSDELFYDVAEIAVKPFICSHSNSRTICPASRNITDDMFRTLMKAGGVTGINFCADFLVPHETADTCCIDDAVRHIEHFLSLGGAKHVCLGGDLDGIDARPRELRGVEDVYRLVDALAQRNYSDDLIYDIFYNNLSRVIRSVIG